MIHPDLLESQKEIHKLARANGFWDSEHDCVPSKLMLIVSEAAEALEEFRSSRSDEELRRVRFPLDEHGRPKPEGFASELADIVIRTMDLAERLEIDLAWIISRKHQYNLTRTFRHGGKRV